MHQPAIQEISADTRLHIAQPERGLEQSFAFGFAIKWAVIVAGGGVIMLLALAVFLFFKRPTTPVAKTQFFW